jgi:cell wall-associated NlpC family hydrolase
MLFAPDRRRIRLLAPPISRRLVAVVAVAGCLTAVAANGPAAANPPGPHDPIGSVSSVVSVSGGVRISGWAVDPDALKSNATVSAIVDGKGSAYSVRTAVANASVTKKYKTGPTPGFSLTVALSRGRRHTVCAAARNVGRGLDTALKCVVTPVGTSLSSSQAARHNPHGAITDYWANPKSVHFFGWTSDPDFAGRQATVVLYVDGRARATVTTQAYPSARDPYNRYPYPRPSGAGGHSAFNILVPTAVGTHIGCIWVVNVGLGTGNALLGCRSMDNRGHAGTGRLSTPALNSKVVAEAKKHIGQDYVWGATGPKTFDCSGLVVYSYHKFGYSTPRTSEQQALAARLIPASRAVPGDLVFYHDTVGDVYHVGIYTGPGKSVAAIDTQEGVNYQTIWDPSSVTYGSFTHT